MANLIPELKHFGPYRIIGLSCTNQQYTELWAAENGFMARRDEIKSPAGDGMLFGISRCLPGGSEYIAATAVSADCLVPDGMIEGSIGDATYAVFTVQGLEQIGQGWEAAHAWIANNPEWETYCIPDANGVCGCVNYPVFEMYPADFGTTGVVYIYFPVKRKA